MKVTVKSCVPVNANWNELSYEFNKSFTDPETGVKSEILRKGRCYTHDSFTKGETVEIKRVTTSTGGFYYEKSK